MSVTDIERAITQLPSNEITQLVVWLEDYHHQIWDKQIENDLDTGRLDAVMAEAEKRIRRGLSASFMNHFTLPRFWKLYDALAKHIQQ